MRIPSPTDLKRFFKTRTGWLLVGVVALLILVLTTGNLRRRAEDRREASPDQPPTAVVGANEQRPVGTMQRETAGSLPAATPTPTPEPKTQQVVAAATPSPTPRPLPPERISLAPSPVGLPAQAAKPTPTPTPEPKVAKRKGRAISEKFAPYGRVIPCQLVFTVDSSRIETPVVGLVTEDVWWNGELIIPAGAEVHGVAQTDRMQGRIRADGPWVVVLPEFSDVLNGTELVIDGAALARQDETIQHGGAETWGIADGSFGMLGKTIRSDKYGDLKLFVAAFLASAAETLQTRDGQVVGPFGGTFQGQIQSTPQNAALSGVAAVVDEYVQQLREEIARNGFYTRVAGGTQFYLYVRQTIDLEDARIGESETDRVNWMRRRAAEQERLSGSGKGGQQPLISSQELELFRRMAQPQQFVPQPDPMPSQIRQQQQGAQQIPSNGFINNPSAPIQQPTPTSALP